VYHPYRYLASSDAKAKVHRLLAGHYDRQPLRLACTLEPNAGKCAELPYQQRACGMGAENVALLSSLEFLDAKCAAGMVYDVIEVSGW